MPRAMSWPHSVRVDGIVYMTPGEYGSRVIHRYDPQTQQWSELPLYQLCFFTMTEVNHQLTVVGGSNSSTHEVSNTVAVYSTSQGWETPYPPMNTPRQLPAAITYNQHLVVAGGSYGVGLATVEILTHLAVVASGSPPLLVNCREMSSATIRDTMYLLGGTLCKQVFSMSLPALIQSDKPSAQWNNLCDASLKYSGAIGVHGSLLAIGGKNTNDVAQPSMCMTRKGMCGAKWETYLLYNLPVHAVCYQVHGEILVAGGQDRKGGTS